LHKRNWTIIMPDFPDLDSWLSAQTWPDLRELVSRGPTTLYRHPYGFVVCRLETDWFLPWQIRVHLWPNRAEMLQRLHENDSKNYLVHCHGWDLKSALCLGVLSESRFELVPDQDSEMSIYRAFSDYGAGRSELSFERGGVRSDLVSEVQRDASTGVWLIQAGQFHSTIVTAGAAVSAVATSRLHRGDSRVILPSTSRAGISNRRSAVENIDGLLVGYDHLYADMAEGADRWASFVFLLDEGNRILLARSSRRPDLWQPIGGRAERLDRDPTATVVREAQEEVGVHLDPKRLIELDIERRDVGEGMVHFWVARIKSENVRSVAHPEILEWRWVPVNAAESLSTYAGTRTALRLLRLHIEGTDRTDG
jgi:8-oxo-dGTP pyrophosphatase MutT (NUDIX family)